MQSEDDDDADFEQFWGDRAEVNDESVEVDNEEELDSSFFTNWRRIRTDDVNVTVSRGGGVHQLLLETAQKEMASVAQGILHHIGGRDPTPSTIVDIFISPLVPVVREAMQASLDENEEEITYADVCEFIHCLSVLSFFGVTPSVFFDPKYGEWYPAAAERNRLTFARCLKTLKRRKHCQFHVRLWCADNCPPERRHNRDNGVWTAPFSEDPHIRELESELSKTNSKLLFIPGTTIVSMDDDQYRLSSPLVESIGLVRVQNPKKAFGPVSSYYPVVLLVSF